MSNIWDRINCDTILWFLSQNFKKNIIEVIENFIQEEMNILFCGKDLCDAINLRSIPNEKYKFTFNKIKIYTNGVIFDFSFHDLNQKIFRKFHLTIKPTPPNKIDKGKSQAHIRFDDQKSTNEFPLSFNFEELPVSIKIDTTSQKEIAWNYSINKDDFREFIKGCFVPGMNLLFSIFSLNDIMSKNKKSIESIKNMDMSVLALNEFKEDLDKILKPKESINKEKPLLLSPNTYNFQKELEYQQYRHPNIAHYETEETRIADEEAQRKAQEEAQRKADKEAKRKAEEEAKRKAEEEAKRKAEEEAKRKAAEEARRKKEEEERIAAEAAEAAENATWTTVKSNPSKGSSKRNNFKQKYLKYKQKYLQLKKLLES